MHSKVSLINSFSLTTYVTFCERCIQVHSTGTSNLPILNSLLAMRISALGMMGGGKQNCSLYAVRGANGDTESGQTQSETPSGRNGPTWGFLLTLIVDVEEAALLVVTPETYQHLIGRATWWLVGLPICEDSEFPGRLLRTVPKGGEKMVYGVCLSVGIFSWHPCPRFHTLSLRP